MGGLRGEEVGGMEVGGRLEGFCEGGGEEEGGEMCGVFGGGGEGGGGGLRTERGWETVGHGVSFGEVWL